MTGYIAKHGQDTHITDVAEIEGLTALHGVEGYVWCSKHGVVHSDTLNPYAYIEDGKQDYCKPEEHQALFVDSDHNVPSVHVISDAASANKFEAAMDAGMARRRKEAHEMPGDPVGEYSGLAAEQFLERTKPKWDDREPIEPNPVRSAPVPLTVRRHTPESKNIWWQNLYNALPADLMDEDREKITTALLEVAISHGDMLRRKRLIDKLMENAEVLEDAAERHSPKMFSAETLKDWVNLLMDAAEEIRSIL